MRTLLATLSALLLLALPAAAEKTDTEPLITPQVRNGVSFLSGGVGDHEQAWLRKVGDDYNVRVALARADGAYLTDIHVSIEDRDGQKLVDTTTRGPILLAELPPGRYRMQASTAGRTTERRVIDVPSADPDQVRLYVVLKDTSDQAKR